jgi:hypothetical protein
MFRHLALLAQSHRALTVSNRKLRLEAVLLCCFQRKFYVSHFCDARAGRRSTSQFVLLRIMRTSAPELLSKATRSSASSSATSRPSWRPVH